MPDGSRPPTDADLDRIRADAERLAFRRRHATAGREGPCTPPWEGTNAGIVRDGRGHTVADTGGHENFAGLIAELLNRPAEADVLALLDEVARLRARVADLESHADRIES